MSMYLRPVIEKWGKSINYSSREHDISEVLAALARNAGAGHVVRKSHDDLRVLWIEDGRALLDYLCATQLGQLSAALGDADLLSDEDEERHRTLEDLRDLKAMSEDWQASIDPEDGSLRFYCD